MKFIFARNQYYVYCIGNVKIFLGCLEIYIGSYNSVIYFTNIRLNYLKKKMKNYCIINPNYFNSSILLY